VSLANQESDFPGLHQHNQPVGDGSCHRLNFLIRTALFRMILIYSPLQQPIRDRANARLPNVCCHQAVRHGDLPRAPFVRCRLQAGDGSSAAPRKYQ
jgi:hypothetical protein